MRRHRLLALAGLLVMFWAVSLPAEGAAPKKQGGKSPCASPRPAWKRIR